MTAAAAIAGWDAARNILCVRLDSLGDVLMTTPAFRALKEGGPERRLTLLTSQAGAAAAELIPEVDETIVYDAPWLKATAPRRDSGPEYAMAEDLRRRGFDAAVIFTVYSQNPLPSAFLCYMAGIPLRLAHCRENPYQLLSDWVKEPEPERFVRHEVRRHLDLVAKVSCRPRNENLSLTIPPAATRVVTDFLCGLPLDPERPWAVVHAGASAPSRRYPPRSFAAAARLLIRRGWQLVFTGSEDERDLVRSIVGALGKDAPAWSAAGRFTLAELAGLIAQAPVLISNNTGPAHMAAALGTPVVDLYALTNPQHSPWAVPHRLLFHDVPCRNCYKSVCPEGHHRCLRLVPPTAVADAACELLRAGRCSSTESAASAAP